MPALIWSQLQGSPMSTPIFKKEAGAEMSHPLHNHRLWSEPKHRPQPRFTIGPKPAAQDRTRRHTGTERRDAAHRTQHPCDRPGTGSRKTVAR